MQSPFTTTPLSPGEGTIHLSLLPPHTPRLKTLKYQYPLKLIAPAPSTITTTTTTTDPASDSDSKTEPQTSNTLVHTIYTLTYGGGLVAGDSINLRLTLEPSTKLILLTQGSTKIFKTPDAGVVSRQGLKAVLEPEAALCYLPDPVQPFAGSCFEQGQEFEVVVPPGDGVGGKGMASLCVLDWFCSGRPANGEDWGFWRYASRNEVWLVSGAGAGGGEDRRLLLRDNVLLDARHVSEQSGGGLAERMYGLAVFGTVILHGPLVKQLGDFFMAEFQLLPRIGGRNFSSSSDYSGSEEEEAPTPREKWRVERQRREARQGVLWTAASVRGCVVVKFGAPNVEVGKEWVRDMLAKDCSVEGIWGERALMCLK